MRKAVLVLLVLVVLGSVMAPTMAVNKRASEKLKLPEELTKDELLQLYRKYNITENDIKFAKGELPHYLEGTILYGKVVTMGKVVKKGNKFTVQNWIDPKFYRWAVDNGYKVVNATDYFEIEEKARKEYIKKYGVDPANPKVEMVNGILLPVDYVKKLVEKENVETIKWWCNFSINFLRTRLGWVKYADHNGMEQSFMSCSRQFHFSYLCCFNI